MAPAGAQPKLRGKRSRHGKAESHRETRDMEPPGCSPGEGRMNGPDKEEKPFLRSDEREQRRREESLRINREEGELKPKGEEGQGGEKAGE